MNLSEIVSLCIYNDNVDQLYFYSWIKTDLFPVCRNDLGEKNPNKKHQPRKPQNTSKQHYHHPQPPIKKNPEIITGKVWGWYSNWRKTAT